MNLVGRLSVDSERLPHVRVTHAGLGGLEVNALRDQGGGVGSPQVVEPDTFEICLATSGEPHTATPRGVLERLARGRGDHMGRSIGSRQTPRRQMPSENVHQRRWHAEGSVPRS